MKARHLGPGIRVCLMAGLLSPVALVACGQDDPGGIDVRAGTPLTVEPAPILAVGVADGNPDQLFDGVTTPFLLADGRLVVPSSGDGRIRLFAPDGNFIASYGGSGEGPGEFGYLTAVWPRGDTIEALDSRLRRITRFFPDGEVEVISIDAPLRDLSAVGGAAPDGWIVGGVASGGAGRRDEIVLRYLALDGSDRGEVASVQGFERFVVEGLGGGPTPLSPRALLAIEDGLAYVAETMTPRIEVRSPSGSLTRTITWTSEPAESADGVFRAVVDAAVDRSPADRATATRQRWEAAGVPERLPVFAAFIVDEMGFIWIRPFEPLRHAAALGGLSLASGGQGGRWTILSPEGSEVGSIELPADLEPIRITADAVVGISRDALDVESVRVHRLNRR